MDSHAEPVVRVSGDRDLEEVHNAASEPFKSTSASKRNDQVPQVGGVVCFMPLSHRIVS